MKKLIIITIGLLTFNCSQSEENDAKENTEQIENKTKEMNIYNFTYKSPNGETKSLAEYTDKVILIVNTATQCGLTPQFEGLEKLHTTYEKKGLKVLGFPCNQFGGQEPLSNEEMVEICKLNHGVTFELTKKIEVNGKNQNEIYAYLKSQKVIEGENDIRWNFEKFVVNRQGEVVKRYSPQTTPEEITKDIEDLL